MVRKSSAGACEMIRLKRIYESPKPQLGDGKRVLVDRLWPRGLSKGEVVVDEWIKEIAPSVSLRKWFAHDPAKWQEFKKRYRQELSEKSEILERIRTESTRGTVTLLYSAKDTEHNNAAVLKEFLS
jgi:uncharacterized protein YeaO (DUF488 family)